MNLIKEFTDRDDFHHWLTAWQESWKPDIEDQYTRADFYKPLSIDCRDFFSLQKIYLSFGDYEQFWILIRKGDNNLYLGANNDGGHATVCAIVRIRSNDIFEKPGYLQSWYADHGRLLFP